MLRRLSEVDLLERKAWSPPTQQLLLVQKAMKICFQQCNFLGKATRKFHLFAKFAQIRGTMMFHHLASKEGLSPYSQGHGRPFSELNCKHQNRRHRGSVVVIFSSSSKKFTENNASFRGNSATSKPTKKPQYPHLCCNLEPGSSCQPPRCIGYRYIRYIGISANLAPQMKTTLAMVLTISAPQHPLGVSACHDFK